MSEYIPNFPSFLDESSETQMLFLQKAFGDLLNDLDVDKQIRTGPPGTITR